MREIKFRAWDIESKDMFSHDELCEEDVIYRQFFNHDKDNHFAIMQYTGLKDKNGVEIYEGDILHSGGINYRLVWEDGKACELHNKQDKYSPRFMFNYLSDIEVIGNIYENPEQLEK